MHINHDSLGHFYDAADQLTGVAYKTGSTTERAVNYFYDSAGNRTNLVEVIGNGTNTTGYVANSDNQLTNVNTTRGSLTVTGYVQPGAASNKWYASVARARSQESGVSSQNGTFAIPGVPVTGGANALTVTVTDVSGNIATQVVNFTVATGATALGYDGNGNQTNHNGWAMTYDRENRLVSATSASLAVNYSYDVQGRLIERRTSGATTTTNRMYYAGWQLIAEYNGAGALQRKYVYGPGIDEPIRMTSGGTNCYYHADGLGSTTEITDGTGNIVESYRYDVYGEPTIYNAAGVVLGTSALGNRILFTGRDRDPDTGWYNYRHRYYNPSLGRFVQPDPIRLGAGDVNLYRYCGNNAVNRFDPLGLFGPESYRPEYQEKIYDNTRAWHPDASESEITNLVKQSFAKANADYNQYKNSLIDVGVDATKTAVDPSSLKSKIIDAIPGGKEVSDAKKLYDEGWKNYLKDVGLDVLWNGLKYLAKSLTDFPQSKPSSCPEK